MTTWNDYAPNPIDNSGSPPVGAPENVPANQVNNILREVMSVIRKMGDQLTASITGLGTMSTQNADAVAITGGTVNATLSGPGGGITNLKAQTLVEGPIPAAVFPADATPLNVKVARSSNADTLGGQTWLQLMPVGAIIMWWSNNPAPAGWHVCDGTAGTPDLRSKFILAAGSGIALGQTGGQFSYNAVSDTQGSHSHGAAVGYTAITQAQMPSHVHQEVTGGGAGGGGFHIISQMSVAQSLVGLSVNTNPAGGDQGHTHSIGADGNHAHNVSVNSTPPFTGVWYIMRIS
jgi:hypothetical protein